MSEPVKLLATGLLILFFGGVYLLGTEDGKKGYGFRPGPSPTTFQVNTDHWSCTTVQLDGKWQWPPICDPKEGP